MLQDNFAVLVENELKKLQTFNSTYFRCKIHFKEDGVQNYLIFHPMYRYFEKISGVGNDEYIYFCKSQGLFDVRNNSTTASNYSRTLSLNYLCAKIRIRFNESYLKQIKFI